MRSNVALIGFMGTGKTSVGKALAAGLGKEFVRTDDLVADRAGKSIPEIFGQDGEPRFRELEAEVVREVSEKRDVVIDCGGGVVLSRSNIDRLRSSSKIILLTASPETILDRVSKDGEQRPLLMASDKLVRIRELLSLREPLYRKSADFEVNTSGLTIDQVVERIMEFLRRDKDFKEYE